MARKKPEAGSKSRRDVLVGAAASAALFGVPGLGGAAASPGAGLASARSPWLNDKGHLKIGLLWSLTGNLSVVERASRDVALFWIDRVNRDGGVAGLKIEPVVVDAKSDVKAYREGALHLINEEGVLAIFGGYTSASRRAVMPLIELNDGLLFYPAFYPGRECWQRIVCTGPIANQHSFDLVPFMCERFGNRVFFVGSNNVRSQESNRNVKMWLTAIGGRVVGESYIPVGHGDFALTFRDIQREGPDWIFSTVVGESDVLFRHAYAKAGFKPDQLPTASLSTSEIEVKIMGHDLGEGHYVSAPYFQSIESESNRRFIGAFLESSHGGSGVTHFTMEETYLSCLYFQKAVEKIVSEKGVEALSPSAVRNACGGLSLSGEESPEGAVQIDPRNFNSWLTPRIGRFRSDGQVEIVAERKEIVSPEPFYLYPSRGECRSDGLHLPHGYVVKSAS